jgi:hypothetical protein
MLKQHPAALRQLLDTYESLHAEVSRDVVPLQARRHLLETEYALCVTTGASTVEQALAETRRRLAEEQPIG